MINKKTNLLEVIADLIQCCDSLFFNFVNKIATF